MSYPLDLSTGTIDDKFKLFGFFKATGVQNLDQQTTEIVPLSSLAGQSSTRIPRVVKNCWVVVTKHLNGTITVGPEILKK